MQCTLTESNNEQAIFNVTGVQSKEELLRQLDVFFPGGEYSIAWSEGDARVYEKNISIKRFLGSTTKVFQVSLGVGADSDQYAIVIKKGASLSGTEADKEFLILIEAIKIYFNR